VVGGPGAGARRLRRADRAVLAFVSIRQAGALQDERTRERTRERLEDKIHALNEALEILVRLREHARATRYDLAAVEQMRLRPAGARASSQSIHDLEIVARINYTGHDAERTELMQSCDGAIDKVVWEIGELAKGNRAVVLSSPARAVRHCLI
jgi:hypothetical protein